LGSHEWTRSPVQGRKEGEDKNQQICFFSFCGFLDCAPRKERLKLLAPQKQSRHASRQNKKLARKIRGKAFQSRDRSYHFTVYQLQLEPERSSSRASASSGRLRRDLAVL
jgi:hypothetical protein